MFHRKLRFIFLFLGLFLPYSLIAAPSDFTVVIDPGHGGKDPGTHGRHCKEKDIVLAVGLKLGKLIAARQPDVKIIYTRSTDEFPSLNERAIIANKAKANLFISIHADYAESSNVRGASTFTLGQSRSAENMAIAKRENSVILLEDDYKQSYEGFDPNSAESYIMFEFMQDNYMNQSIQLASTIQGKFTASGRYDRGVRQDVFLVLRCTSMPSVLIEVGFLSNPLDEAYLMSEAGQEQTALNIYRGFADFKADYDRKSTNTASLKKPKSTEATVKVDTEKVVEIESKPLVATETKKSDIVFKVQIFATDSKIASGNRKLKGLDADYYFEKNLYKYTVGSFNSFEEANQKCRSVSALFTDAFVIAFKNGLKIPVELAKRDANK